MNDDTPAVSKPVKLRRREKYNSTKEKPTECSPSKNILEDEPTPSVKQTSAIDELAYALNGDGSKSSSHIASLFDGLLQKKIAEVEQETRSKCAAMDDEAMRIIEMNTANNDDYNSDISEHSKSTVNDNDSKHKRSKHKKKSKKKHKHKDKHHKKDKKRSRSSSVEYDASFWGDYKLDEHFKKKTDKSESGDDKSKVIETYADGYWGDHSKKEKARDTHKHKKKKDKKRERSHSTTDKSDRKRKFSCGSDKNDVYKPGNIEDSYSKLRDRGRSSSIERLPPEKEDRLIEERLSRAKRAAAEREKKLAEEREILLAHVKSEPLSPKGAEPEIPAIEDEMKPELELNKPTLALPVRKNEEVPAEEEPTAVPLVLKGTMKLAFKISDSSAALIQAGEKAEEKANKVPVLEDGEVPDPVEDDGTKSPLPVKPYPEPNRSRSSSPSSGTPDSSGELTDSDNDKSRRRRRRHRRRHRSGSRSRHRHSRSQRSNSRSKSRHHDSRGRSRRSRYSRTPSPKPFRSRCSRSRDRHDRTWRRSRSKSWEKDRGFDARNYRVGNSYTRGGGNRYDRNRGHNDGPNYRGASYFRRHSRSKSRSRSRERRRLSRERANDPGVKIDKNRLREIAIANALNNAKNGGVPVTLKPELLAELKSQGKSVQELTKFCSTIAKKDDNMSSSDESTSGLMPTEESDEQPFINHPFQIKESNAAIKMNIRNAQQLAIQTPAEKLQNSSKLRLQFPVSSGSHHRVKEDEWTPVQRNPEVARAAAKQAAKQAAAEASSAKAAAYGSAAGTQSGTGPPESTPVVSPATGGGSVGGTTAGVGVGGVAGTIPAAHNGSQSESAVAPEDRVFPEEATEPVNVGDIVSQRLSAMRKLQNNPHDMQAMSSIYNCQRKMDQWANRTELPGQFTGSTNAKILTAAQLGNYNPKKQAWAKKDTFHRAAPVSGGIGMCLLQKMGWKHGEGLGKNNEGSVEPLSLDVKMDRKGLQATQDKVARPSGIKKLMPTHKDLSGKHPVSALLEICNKRRWGAPNFALVHESGPDHQKNFLFKVTVNGKDYQSSVASNNKKQAKSQCATSCLQELGMVP